MRAVISPHLDDAVLSCGSWLAESGSPVLTVFAGVPTSGILTPYDSACGFQTSNQAMLERRKEDAAALGELGCAWARLGYMDVQYRQERPAPVSLAADIADALRDLGAEGAVVPAGIQHPDHLLCAEACRVLASEDWPVWIYEELPYRVLYPDLARAALSAWQEAGFMLVEDFLGGGETEAKEQAVACYRSQTFDPHTPFVPERYWQARCV